MQALKNINHAVLLSAGLTGFFLQSCSELADRRPNVIVIITDDQGYGDLRSHGNEKISTPNIDKLYRESVHFTNFHTGTTCAPTRAGIMTGKHSNAVGVWHTICGRSILQPDQTTLAEILQNEGYKTAMFGKWHLGNNYPYSPQYRGFQESLIHKGGGVGQAPDYWGNNYFNDTYFRNGKPVKVYGYCTDVWFENAINFIEENSAEEKKSKPFFCYISTNAPHGPFHIDSSYIRPYLSNENIPNPNFYGMITNIDENFARLDSALGALGLKENTILIFMTDNGTSAGVDLDKDGYAIKGFNAGMRGKKGSEYEGGHRVPFFIRWEKGGITGPKDIDALAGYIDIMPTIIDLAGLEWKPESGLDGISLKPSIHGNADSTRTLIVDTQRRYYPIKWKNSCVMNGTWRLINKDELYNLDYDPSQKKNIADKHPEIVSTLRSVYEDWWAKISPTFDVDSDIPVGDSIPQPVVLCAHDWHIDRNTPWHQNSVKTAKQDSGAWLVNFKDEGIYRFSLYRWPSESGLMLGDGFTPGKAVDGQDALVKGIPLDIGFARIKFNEQDTIFRVNKYQPSGSILLKAEKGKAFLDCRFITTDGQEFGAYYTEIEFSGNS